MAHSAFKVTRLNTVTEKRKLIHHEEDKKMMENTCLKASRQLAFTIIELLRADYFSTLMILGMTSNMKEINAAVFDNSNIPVMIILHAPVVKMVDRAIHRINLYPWIVQLVSLIVINWIVIYLVDSAITF